MVSGFAGHWAWARAGIKSRNQVILRSIRDIFGCKFNGGNEIPMKIKPVITRAHLEDAAAVAAIGSSTFYETWRPVNTEEDMQLYIARAFAVDLLEKELAQADFTFLLASHH